MADNTAAINDAMDHLGDVPSDPSQFVASNGVRLKLKRVPQLIIADATHRVPPPKVPVTFSEDKQRNEENPNDPAYIQARQDYLYDMSVLAINTYFILGTQVVFVPEDVSTVASQEWSDNLEAIGVGIDVPAAGPRRYLAWLKYYALNDHDMTALAEASLRYSGGTMEADVRAAQDTFRNQPKRDTAIRVLPATDESRPGDQSRFTTGDGTGVRGPGSSGVSFGDVGALAEPPLL